MKLPRPRGPLSSRLFQRLGAPRDLDAGQVEVPVQVAECADPIGDGDLQVSLWVLYELHYRSFEDVDDGWEWSADLLRVREQLEQRLENALRVQAGPYVSAVLADGGTPTERLGMLADSVQCPPLAEFIQHRASAEQVRDFLAHKSVYQLKEADPHTWVVPRLEPALKARLIELQFDEYGDGQPTRVHQTLYANALAAAGLDAGYGAYVDQVPPSTLALSNAASLFGLHRRLCAAAIGHLTAVETTSSVPCRRYAAGIRRCGFGADVAFFFDEHVEADSVHEQLALVLCTELVASEPGLEPDLLFGAAACLLLDARFADGLLGRWQQHPEDAPSPTTAALA